MSHPFFFKFFTASLAITFASSVAAEIKWSDVKPIASLSAGVAITDDVGASDNFKISVTSFDYDTDKNTQAKGLFGGLLGLEIEPIENFGWQTGIAYYQTTPFSISGNQSQEFTPPTRDTFPYTYEIISRQLLWENKFLWKWGQFTHPYLFVGIGAAFNTAQNFTIHHNTSTFTPDYEDKRRNSFTYSVGLGFDQTILPRVRLGIAYRFADLGKAGLGDGHWTTPLASASAPNFSSQSHLYTQEVLVQLTFLL